ncbi:MAG: restriction endonuclease subunit S [Candidatus Udaeobacter sp.]
MSANHADWKEVRLGEILRYLDERVTLDDNKEYFTITVKRRHGGLDIREKLFGCQIATKKQFRLVPGAFIISRVQCWHQAYAIVGDVPANTIASTNYDQFAISPEVDPRFFWWLSHSPGFTETVRSSAVGVVIEKMVFNREEWLTKSVPLPPWPEQRRLVARIEELAAQICEARVLRYQAAEEAEALLRSILANDKQSRPTPRRELVRLRPPDVNVRPDEVYQFAGVYSFGRGVFKGGQKSGMEFAYPNLTRLKAGEFVYPKLMAWEGALAVVPPECDGCVVSTEFPVFEVNEERVFHEVLDTYFRTPSVWPEISGASTGTNVRRRRLNPQDFLNYKMPVPSRETQMTLRKVKREVDALKRLQAESTAELDALLPSILDKAFKGEL